MRAVICREPGRLERISLPRPAPDGRLVPVDIKAIGVCGTDFHILEGTHPFLEYPRVMGHELSGVVAEGGGRLAAGTRVVINPYLSCGTCIACRKGKPNCCMRIRVLGVHTDGAFCEEVEDDRETAGGASGLDAVVGLVPGEAEDGAAVGEEGGMAFAEVDVAAVFVEVVAGAFLAEAFVAGF